MYSFSIDSFPAELGSPITKKAIQALAKLKTEGPSPELLDYHGCRDSVQKFKDLCMYSGSDYYIKSFVKHTIGGFKDKGKHKDYEEDPGNPVTAEAKHAVSKLRTEGPTQEMLDFHGFRSAQEYEHTCISGSSDYYMKIFVRNTIGGFPGKVIKESTDEVQSKPSLVVETPKQADVGPSKTVKTPKQGKNACNSPTVSSKEFDGLLERKYVFLGKRTKDCGIGKSPVPVTRVVLGLPNGKTWEHILKQGKKKA